MAKIITLRNKIYIYIVNHILNGTKKNFFELKRRMLNKTGMKIDIGTKIVGPIECSGKLIIGKNCWIGKNLKINGNGVVIIGDNCDIGPEVTFQTGGHEIGLKDRRAGTGINFKQKVGNGTWIGGNVTILNDSIIGNSCVVAGCACVVGNISDNTLVAGIPAKEIKKL